MYEYGDLFALSSSSLPEFFPATLPSPPPPPPPPLLLPNDESDSVGEVLMDPTSLPSYNYYYYQRPNLLQRCMSSQSLSNEAFHYPRHNPIFSSLDESTLENMDFEASSMRKVFSTGDLQTINLAAQQQQQQQQQSHLHQSESPLSHENCNVEGTKKVRCYSAQERKERIERYRNKRSQRNFNKKIKYACRKTLADSRPRIRGRFARNEEMIGESIQNQWSLQEDEDEDVVWANYFLSAYSTNLIP